MHLQENGLFDIYLGVKVTRNVAHCPLHHVTYAATKFEVATSNSFNFRRRFIYNECDRLMQRRKGRWTMDRLLRKKWV